MDSTDAKARWEQLGLFPPEGFRLDFTVFLGTDPGTTQYGWAVRELPSWDFRAIEVVTNVNLALVPELAGRDLMRLVREWRKDLPPFP